MRYIGVRSSTVPPIEDTLYWGSSKYTPDNIKQNHTKIILKEHSTRKLAVEHEIELHNLNDVALSSDYYNRSKQTVTGFDTSGTQLTEEHKSLCSDRLKGRVFTEEHKRNISLATTGKPKSDQHKINCSLAQKALVSSGYTNPRKGVVLSEETKARISSSKKAAGLSKSTKNNRFSPWFITSKDVTELFYDKTKAEYAEENELSIYSFRSAFLRSKGTVTLKRGAFAGMVLGNIPNLKI